MYNIAWSDDFAVGVPAIDLGHQKLIVILNELLAACFACAGPSVIARTMDELIVYTKDHLMQEEVFLASLGYAGLEEHQAQHRELMREIEKTQRALAQGATHELSNNTLSLLAHWFVDHIQAEQEEFAPLLIKHGIEKVPLER